jgi:hypothetical protein
MAAMMSHAMVRAGARRDRRSAMGLVQAERREHRGDGEGACGDEEEVMSGQRERAEVGPVRDDADRPNVDRGVAHAELGREHACVRLEDAARHRFRRVARRRRTTLAYVRQRLPCRMLRVEMPGLRAAIAGVEPRGLEPPHGVGERRQASARRRTRLWPCDVRWTHRFVGARRARMR